MLINSLSSSVFHSVVALLYDNKTIYRIPACICGYSNPPLEGTVDALLLCKIIYKKTLVELTVAFQIY